MDSAAPSTSVNTGAAADISRPMAAADLAAVEVLHDAAFGPGALTRTAYRVREGQPLFTPFCRVLYRGSVLVAAIRYTEVLIGGKRGALMLGPLAVSPAFANQGHGRRLIAESLQAAEQAGVALIVLVGDPPYYARFGFSPIPMGQITMPGPVDPARLLAKALPAAGADADADALQSFQGRIQGAF